MVFIEKLTKKLPQKPIIRIQGDSVNEYIFKENKGFRLLNIYERLNKGETVNKEKLAGEFGVSPKTIQRDLDDLRAHPNIQT